MKKNKILFISLGLVIGLIALSGIVGCNGSSEIIKPPDVHNYQISGILVKDLNAASAFDTTRIALNLYRNDTMLTDADVDFFNQTLSYTDLLAFCDPSYKFPTASQSMIPAGTHYINIVDDNLYNDSVAVPVVDTFRVLSYNPDSLTVNAGGGAVNIQWTTSANIEGYIIAVTPADSAYGGYGYSAYVTSQGSLETIPPDAFRTPDFANELVIGTYYIYIYAYTGSPDSALACQSLPVPLPSQLPDNIDQPNMTGKFGTVVITKRVPLLVTAS